MPMKENEAQQKRAVKQEIPAGKAESYNHVKYVVAVMSGKGGVGKSLNTGLLAAGLARRDYAVGVMDGDITGPSIPKLFGLHGPVSGGQYGILPLESRTGIKVISMNLLLEREDQPVIWRGPMVSKAIQQLWGDVMWGELDVLLIDLPPGTSDATLTIMQSLPVDGLIMVTTPQSLASLVVRKAVHMAQMVDVKISGIIENMAYFICPDTGKPHYIFGESHSGEVAEAAEAPILARIPIDPAISSLCDAGEVEAVDFKGLNELLNQFSKAIFGESSVEPAQDDQVGQQSSVMLDGADDLEQDEDLAIYSETAQKIILGRENMGRFEHPHLSGKVRGCCGDSMQIDLLIEGDMIKNACYSTDGCSATMACGGMLTRLLRGKTLAQAVELKPETLIHALGGLPKQHIHCANLAIKTMRATLERQGFVDEFSGKD